MKKYISTLMTISHETIYKILLVFALLAAGQFLFTNKFVEKTLLSNNTAVASRFDIFLSSNIPLILIFGAAFLLITGILIFVPNYRYDHKPDVFKDLNISEKELFFCRTFYNCCCYIMLIGIEILILRFSVSALFINQNTVPIENQILILAAYRNSFMHALFPLWDLPVYLRNALLILGLGASTAIYTSTYRLNKNNYQVFVLVPLTLVLFPATLDSYAGALTLGIVSLIILLRSIELIRKEKPTKIE